MVSFQCDGCADVVKKPKLDQHSNRCGASFTCVDCSKTFRNQREWKDHTSCISEAEKYQKSFYKGKKQGAEAGPRGDKKNASRPVVKAHNGSKTKEIEIETQLVAVGSITEATVEPTENITDIGVKTEKKGKKKRKRDEEAEGGNSVEKMDKKDKKKKRKETAAEAVVSEELKKKRQVAEGVNPGPSTLASKPEEPVEKSSEEGHKKKNKRRVKVEITPLEVPTTIGVEDRKEVKKEKKKKSKEAAEDGSPDTPLLEGEGEKKQRDKENETGLELSEKKEEKKRRKAEKKAKKHEA